ncbi:glycosyltransferase 87 family protein, partial [uncultured Jatrophihabitans sp.]|uniref:glycosyltransferase 87 family protein n=1 Tax=uncultured Jatrophihabitans sp. TaxID=1610747 RepID=UPI0035CA7FE6
MRLIGTAPRAGVLLAVSVVAYLVTRALLHPSMIDFAVYRVEGDALRRGHRLYENLPTPQGLLATYPPFAAAVFVPAAMLSWPVARALAVAGNLVLLVVVSRQSVRLAGITGPSALGSTAVIAAVTLWAEPVYTTLGNGQVNLAVLALVLADFTCAPQSRWRGVGTGLAAGLKVTPGLFIVYLLLTRRFRAAATATGVFAATIAASGVVAPVDTWRYWTRYVWQSGRVGDLANSTNQSMQGLLARAAGVDRLPTALAVLCLVVAVAALATAVLAYRRLGEVWGLTCAAVAGLLGAPIAWTHHWVWCVPITALVVARRPKWGPLVLVFWTFALFYLPHKADAVLTFPWWRVALTNWYVLFGVGFVAAVWARLRRRPAQAAAPPPPRGAGGRAPPAAPRWPR